MLSFQIKDMEFTGPYLPEAKMAANNACFLRGFVTKCRSGKERMQRRLGDYTGMHCVSLLYTIAIFDKRLVKSC